MLTLVRSEGWRTEARVPAGVPQGGRWTSGGQLRLASVVLGGRHRDWDQRTLSVQRRQRMLADAAFTLDAEIKDGRVYQGHLVDLPQVKVYVRPESGMRKARHSRFVPTGNEVGRDLAAECVNQALGSPIDIPVIARTKQTGQQRFGVQADRASVQLDASARAKFFLESYPNVRAVLTDRPEELAALALFDFITGACDRHITNVLFRPSTGPGERKTVSIDHEIVFPEFSRHNLEGFYVSSFLLDRAREQGVTKLSVELVDRMRLLFANYDWLSAQLRAHGISEIAINQFWQRARNVWNSGAIPTRQEFEQGTWMKYSTGNPNLEIERSA